jgi:hypothetical protein
MPGSPRSPVCVFTAILAIAVLACSNPTDEGPARFPLARDWQYSAEQRAPGFLRVNGSVRISSQSGTRFDGSVDVVELDDTGVADRRVGLLGGRFQDSVTVDFDIRLESEIRRHVGRVSADTISGEWALTSGGSASGGTFRMVRQ